ncbi:hypothetical protein B0I35DRAFT_2627 [Stachybotrys elegans]|uniref:Uncharacterized protein n=1 Tax=Stachybotrys elegans TaxID=80388 RepID=A0A8K0WXH8_9HYPO|nr:hypothetical protein B0I35DRAFT_2627 [Stachybotrys elegans]
MDNGLNFTDPHLPHAGWVSASRDRGSIDILWSCGVTLMLCCWVATHPNAYAPNSTTYHRFRHKVQLAALAISGPEFVLGIAAGQFCSASRSVRLFKGDPLPGNRRWTLTHAFFVDMGGIHLVCPDFDSSFPITAMQLHYLIKNNFLDFPDMEKMDISERNTSDILARLITLWQVIWFSITELERFRLGLPMTTLELTTLSFVLSMVGTELCWIRKPSAMTPRFIHTKDGKQLQEIRQWAKDNTHPDLADEWHETPLAFLDGKRFHINTQWLAMTQLFRRFRMMPRTLYEDHHWDHIPNDFWHAVDGWILIPLAIILAVFGLSFVGAWNFYFPTEIERTLWRICSVGHAIFCTYIAFSYVFALWRWRRDSRRAIESVNRMNNPRGSISLVSPAAIPEGSVDLELGTANRAATEDIAIDRIATGGTRANGQDVSRSQSVRVKGETSLDPEGIHKGKAQPGIRRRVFDWVIPYRAIAADLLSSGHDINFFMLVMHFVMWFFYCFFRAYIYTEDIAGMREQPVGVYLTGNRFVPFIGS